MKINLDKLRPLVTFTFTEESEHERPEDHFKDAETIAEVRKAINDEARYSYGPIPQWFCAKVVASYGDLESDPQYLGCCSYDSFDAFKEDDYYSDMCTEALANLATQLQETLDRLLPLVG